MTDLITWARESRAFDVAMSGAMRALYDDYVSYSKLTAKAPSNWRKSGWLRAEQLLVHNEELARAVIAAFELGGSRAVEALLRPHLRKRYFW